MGDAKKKKKKKKKATKKISSFLFSYVKTLVAVKKAANYEDSTFHRKEKDNMKQLQLYLPHPNNIVGWCSALTDIGFIINSQFTNKVILLWGMHFKSEETGVRVEKAFETLASL